MNHYEVLAARRRAANPALLAVIDDLARDPLLLRSPVFTGLLRCWQQGDAALEEVVGQMVRTFAKLHDAAQQSVLDLLQRAPAPVTLSCNKAGSAVEQLVREPVCGVSVWKTMPVVTFTQDDKTVASLRCVHRIGDTWQPSEPGIVEPVPDAVVEAGP